MITFGIFCSNIVGKKNEIDNIKILNIKQFTGLKKFLILTFF